MVLTTLLALLPHCAPAADQSTALRLIAAESIGIRFAININGAFGLSQSTAEYICIHIFVVASSKGDHQFPPNQRATAIVLSAPIGKLEQRGAAAQCLLRHCKAILFIVRGHQKLLLCDSGFARVLSANQKSTFPQSRGARA